jgi:hypothetical protein
MEFQPSPATTPAHRFSQRLDPFGTDPTLTELPQVVSLERRKAIIAATIKQKEAEFRSQSWADRAFDVLRDARFSFGIETQRGWHGDTVEIEVANQDVAGALVRLYGPGARRAAWLLANHPRRNRSQWIETALVEEVTR